MYRLFAIFLGFMIIGISVWIVSTSNNSVRHFITAIDNLMYDEHLHLIMRSKKPASKNSQIGIVDIDDRSIIEQGSWPWPRVKFAQLLTNLRESGVSVIAFSFVFAAESDTTASNYLKKIQQQNAKPSTELVNVLNHIIYLHEGDEIFANTLKMKDDVVLSLIFDQSSRYSKAAMPKPIYEIKDNELRNQLLIPVFNGYTSNYPQLQNIAKYSGFVTGVVDEDGIIRHAPLLIIYNHGIYPSLALEAVRVFLHGPTINIHFSKVGDHQVVRKIVMGNKEIFTDASGIISISYQGGKNYIPYYSATDILNKRIPANELAGKIIFIGTSATGLSDLRPTPFESLFPAVEIQANIAQDILSNDLPYTPSWSKGAEVGLIILIGGLLAIILPFMRAIPLAITLLFLLVLLVYSYVWLWSIGLIFSFSAPILTVIVLITFNLVYGFLFETRKHESLYKTFTKYVPAEYAKKISAHPDESFEGENKTATVLFSDVRHFTDIAESLTEHNLKNFLNELFTPITEIIMKHQGTVDKYVGDMVIAFWIASNENCDHTKSAIAAAIEIENKLKELQHEFAKLDLPTVKVGIGINTGLVNIGEIGSESRRSYTIIGDTVNLASRLEELTKFYHVKIIIGESTYNLCKEELVCRYLDRIIVKGRHNPVEIYELICKTEDATDELYEELNAYSQALDLYYTQQWDEAFEKFLNLVRAYPHTRIYSIFLKRIKEFFINPPNGHWDGTYMRTKK